MNRKVLVVAPAAIDNRPADGISFVPINAFAEKAFDAKLDVTLSINVAAAPSQKNALFATSKLAMPLVTLARKQAEPAAGGLWRTMVLCKMR